MNAFNDIPSRVDDHIERLISRCLDGELTPDQQAELDQILNDNSAARVLFDDYQRNDQLAASALRADFSLALPGASTTLRSRRGIWMMAAGAILAAAAMVALSILPAVHRPNHPLTAQGISPSIVHTTPMVSGQFVDYKNMDLGPKRRLGDIRQEFLGIRGDDPNVIYLFQRKAQSTRIVPVSGDF